MTFYTWARVILTAVLMGVMQPTVHAQDTNTSYIGEFAATHYGTSYNGRTMGCGGTYRSSDTSILAVGPSLYASLPCHTPLRVDGPNGSIYVTRTDSCGGCDSYTPRKLDLSEAGITAVCGSLGSCRITLVRIFYDD